MIVINSSPAINLTSVLGDLGLLTELYGPVIIPYEVFTELAAGADKDATAEKLSKTQGITIRDRPIHIPKFLRNTLDLGESAVIQTALDEAIPTVVLDDLKGRRIVALSGLEVTGSAGVLIQAKKVGRLASVGAALAQLKQRGTWLHPSVVNRALELAGESPVSSL
ncbi:DUF3368 domain-containing protein [Methylomagnum sp.]